MSSNIDDIASEIDKLVDQGLELVKDLYGRIKEDNDDGPSKFAQEYEGWYTVSRRVVSQLIPEREADFVSLYRFTGNRKSVNYENFRIVDFLHGTRLTDWDGSLVFRPDSRAFAQFQIQVQILQSAKSRATSKLMDIKDVLAADLFDTEIDKARALHKNKLLREAGVIAGVVLEAHLQKVAKSHAAKITKKEPTIADLNDPIKNAGVYDVPTWRLIQRLADIRNLCDHKKQRDPTADEVLELIDGTDKITKTVY